MGNWLKKLKENVIRAQLALEIPLARRRGIAARKYWEKIKDQTEEGLRLAGFESLLSPHFFVWIPEVRCAYLRFFCLENEFSAKNTVIRPSSR